MLTTILALGGSGINAQEFRALWVDTFHPALRNGTEVTQLVADARAGNFNAIIVEVRKRGDAYYNSLIEPKASDVIPQSFDPLADLITKANTNGPRIEVHAWITTYLIWNSQTTPPPQPDHPYLIHSDWLSRDVNGNTHDGSNYQFDQGHPAVQDYVFRVAMDIISRYDIDGFHFDYVRYSGRDWGYHPVTLDRFNRLHDRSGTPSPTDSEWLQFRRDQVTSLVRKVYLSAIALKPQIKLSAATICFAPGISSTGEWFSSSSAWNHVLQDWRGWMEEGILDINIPMAYFRQHTHAQDFKEWSDFAMDHRYNRHVAIGSGVYLNSISNSIHQFRSTRATTRLGNNAQGVAAYSYAVSNKDGIPNSTFRNALTQPGPYDPEPVPLFAEVVPPPDMPWKSDPTRGHLKGFVTADESGDPLDGATINLDGPVNRTLISDATGFFGAANLPPGTYTLTAAFPDRQSRSGTRTVVAGTVATLDLPLALPSGAGFLANITALPGHSAALITWETPEQATARVQYGVAPLLDQESPLHASPSTRHAVLLTGLSPDTSYSFHVHSETIDASYTSAPANFQTAGDLILDNTQAEFTGNWTTGTSAPGRYGEDYRFASAITGPPDAIATYTPDLPAPGRYDVYTWFPQGGNRSPNAPFTIQHRLGSQTVLVNQQQDGGAWHLLAQNLPFNAGRSGHVQLANNADPVVVLADAVRFAYSEGQDDFTGETVPDWWAFYYFGGTIDATVDHDEDGYSTAQEHLLGTAPDDPDSTLSFELILSEPSERSFHVEPFHAGRGYHLQGRDSLETGDWSELSMVSISTNGLGGAILIENGSHSTHRYYRLRITAEP